MQIIGLDGKTYKWQYQNKRRKKSSELHNKVRLLLQEIFPFEIINEEVYLAGTKTAKHRGLYADFYIHSHKMIIEAHGEQHYKFNPHHYTNKLGFGKARNRNSDKELWCTINNLIYVELPYNESTSEWRARIQSSYRKVDES